MGSLNFRNAYEFDPETYRGEGGLLSRLQAMVQQSQVQTSVNSGSTLNGAPEYNSDYYDSPQGGLLGRLLALQAEQSGYQPTLGNTGRAPSALQSPDVRQVSRAPIPVGPQDTDGPPTLSDNQSNPAYSPTGARPEHPFFDRLLAYWDNPDPHGLIAMLKAASSGAQQAVQGSIDATSTPSTEEEAFRQNLGRELGPIGAFRAVSSPLTPGGATGAGQFLARFLLSRAGTSLVAGTNPLSPKPAVPPEQSTNGLPGIVSGKPMPQWPFPPPIFGPRR